MTSQHSKDTEMVVEKLLLNLGKQGVLYENLTNEDIEAILVNASSVPMSEMFQQRALAAMRDAQTKSASTLSSIELGTQIMQARQQAELDMSKISQEISVPVKVMEALETGQLNVGKIMHNFPVATMLRLLHTLQIRVHDFTKTLMDIAENTGASSGFAETQAAYRKHTSDDVNVLVEVTDYVAHLERLDRDS
jgi:hypothetical protein